MSARVVIAGEALAKKFKRLTAAQVVVPGMLFAAMIVYCSSELFHLRMRSSSSSLLIREQNNVTAGLPNLGATAAGEDEGAPTGVEHIVFAVAGNAKTWNHRQEYVKLWWGPQNRGYVWLDLYPSAAAPSAAAANNLPAVERNLPEIRISADTSAFPYTWRSGSRSAIREARMLLETFRRNLTDVRWFVMGDDDTVFVPQNLAAVLRKYDHRQLVYVGHGSESQKQSVAHSFSMAYGGGGIAVSYALAEALSESLDGCLHRYAHVYGSDSRIEGCAAELGVSLTREPGFRQMDVVGSIFGLLAAHPTAALVSLHHLDAVEPIFPSKTRVEGAASLWAAGRSDALGLLQQSVCYDGGRGVALSVSWGYVVQVFEGRKQLALLDLRKPALTFGDWHSKRQQPELFTLAVRRLPANPCDNPSTFFLDRAPSRSVAAYRRHDTLRPPSCRTQPAWDTIYVFKEPHPPSWLAAPRQQCCEVVSPTVPFFEEWVHHPRSLHLHVRTCKRGEIIAPIQ